MKANTDRNEDRTALVTGAGRGIGRAVAMDLSRRGIFVYINYRSGRETAQKTLEAILAENGEARLLQFDQTDQDACEQAVKEIVRERNRIDILVNNAGIRDDRLLAMMKKESWQRVIDTNLTGFFHVTKPVVKYMLKNRTGRIINITSAAGQTGNPGQVNYSASKAGLIGATKALAREVGNRGITVNAVAPGFIETDMIQGMDREEIAKTIPAGRLGKPGEVAALVSFLCSPKAAYVNGQVIGVNGGMI
ncbi:3-oxoacyl-ACP reductase FabG [Desulfospira joergensenii]|uniref:3-oxoacyl-ACP reductase FabG n=1 Tax=Desulfospira joergensenii TaxID=53329 RepID=UPI0003B42994|nr:3-oxoacyl-ACP reductase FabG [Desulfospira joergensenii]